MSDVRPARDEEALHQLRTDPEGYFEGVRRAADIDDQFTRKVLTKLGFAVVDKRWGIAKLHETSESALDSATRNDSVYKIQLTVLEKVQ